MYDTHAFPFVFIFPPLQLVPKATHSKNLDQSFGSARMQCTASNRKPEDCRDPRVLEDILGKYYPSKYRGIKGSMEKRWRKLKGERCPQRQSDHHPKHQV